MHAMRPEKLIDQRLVPVWNLQRSFRLERAELIAKAKTKDPRLGLPGVISIYELPVSENPLAPAGLKTSAGPGRRRAALGRAACPAAARARCG